MNKTVIKLISALLSGLIAFVALTLLNRFNLTSLPVSLIALYSLIAAAFMAVILEKSILASLKHICCELDWAEETVSFYRSIPAVYRKSFWLLFGLINLAFLFHTINFMWGSKDWAAIRTYVNHAEALNEGRFAAFWLQELLFGGKLLPVANNLWAFLGLSLSAVLLAIYWDLPKTAPAIVITGLLYAASPYALSWLYFAKNALGILWLPTIILTALILSETKGKTQNRTSLLNLASVFLFFAALGTYLPVINLIAVIILGKILLKTAAGTPLKQAFYKAGQSLANLTAAALLFAFVIVILKNEGIMRQSYNTALTPFFAIPFKIPALFKVMFAQFAVALPFADIFYKALFLVLTLSAVFTLIFRSASASAAGKALIIIPLILIASKLTFLLSVASPQNPAHLARIDFFGLPFIYTLMFAVFLKFGTSNLKKGACALAVLLIFMGFVRISYALKVWKFGWDAETKLAERIITRLEKMPNFDINQKYNLVQIGEKSLRAKYYLKKPYEINSGELLDFAYYPAGAASDAYNFFYQTDFLEKDEALDTALKNPEIRHYLLTSARPYPAKESIAIIGNYIILILDDTALANAKAQISPN